MGGRGSASKFGANSVAGAKSFQSLSDFMYNNYSIRINPNLAKADLECVKDAVSGIEFILKEFPQVLKGGTPFLFELTDKEGKANAYASASLSGMINLNPDKFTDKAAVDAKYANDVKAGFHPEGTTSAQIATHEAGHLIERMLVHREFGSDNDYGTRVDRVTAWNKSKLSTRIISEAAKAAKKMPSGKGLTDEQLVAQVSRYATKNRSEALAECVADYQANGGKAKALSVAVWNVLKKELG